jgi:hypothetical protein
MIGRVYAKIFCIVIAIAVEAAERRANRHRSMLLQFGRLSKPPMP